MKSNVLQDNWFEPNWKNLLIKEIQRIEKNIEWLKQQPGGCDYYILNGLKARVKNAKELIKRKNSNDIELQKRYDKLFSVRIKIVVRENPVIKLWWLE